MSKYFITKKLYYTRSDDILKFLFQKLLFQKASFSLKKKKKLVLNFILYHFYFIQNLKLLSPSQLFTS